VPTEGCSTVSDFIAASKRCIFAIKPEPLENLSLHTFDKDPAISFDLPLEELANHTLDGKALIITVVSGLPEYRIPKFGQLLMTVLPSLGDPRFGSRRKTTVLRKSLYAVNVQLLRDDFGILDEFRCDQLNEQAHSLLMTEVEYGSLNERWKGVDITLYTDLIMKDICRAAGILCCSTKTRVSKFSLSCVFGTNPGNVLSLFTDTGLVVGVFHIVIPGYPMDCVSQVVDYMVDIRNASSVKYVYGVLTTYEEWRILWFSDTNDAAGQTTTKAYDELCASAVETNYVMSGDLHVYASKVYSHSDPELIEVLASFVYKSSNSPIVNPKRFLDPNRVYLKATHDALLYETLPKGLQFFTYSVPNRSETTFHILKYYRSGGDGRVALCTTPDGNLGVLKFPVDESLDLDKEAELWNKLWGTDVPIIRVCSRRALLFPFCFHIKVLENKPVFCGLSEWNGIKSPDHQDLNGDDQIRDKVNPVQLKYYQEDPAIACRTALERMCEFGLEHGNWKWDHVALLPKYNTNTDQYDLSPILLDLSFVRKVSLPKEVILERVEKMMS
jgi:hypothetical protein